MYSPAVPQRTSLNLERSLITDVKLALLEAEQAGVEAPRNVSQFATEAMNEALQRLRERIQAARGALPKKG